MFLDVLDKKIRQSFSKAALEYDVLTSLHKEIGRELSKKIIDHDRVDHILDIGMGTGWLTNRIRFFLPDSLLVGLDFAPGMTLTAKKKWEDLNILQGHACHLPFKKASLDMIVSNLAYQWVDDLTQAFQEASTCLKHHGRLYATLFGYKTFEELFLSLGQADSQHVLPDLKRLAGREVIRQALKDAGFSGISIREEYIKVRFPNMIGLLKWIKSIGANVLTPNIFLGKERLKSADQYYQKHFTDRLGTYATLEVLWVEAFK